MLWKAQHDRNVCSERKGFGRTKASHQNSGELGWSPGCATGYHLEPEQASWLLCLLPVSSAQWNENHLPSLSSSTCFKDQVIWSMESISRSCILLYRNMLGPSFTLSRPQFLPLSERWMSSEVAEFKMMTEETERGWETALMPDCQRRRLTKPIAISICSALIAPERMLPHIWYFHANTPTIPPPT